MRVILFLIFAVLLIIFGPLLTIWSLNTLFPVLNIAYGIAEWFAALILGSVVGGRAVSFSRD
jgi:hypothetical protein